MRYMGLDLGTKTLGVALSDESKTLASVYKVIHFKSEDYLFALNEVLKIIKDKNVIKIALGLPKNMDNTEGFASKRSLNFKSMLEEKTDIPVILIDERLTTVEAEGYLLTSDASRKKRKKVIDGVAAEIILDTFMRREENKNE